VTCLRHAAIVETQKSVNTLRNNRGSGVYSVPCRAEPSSTAPRSLPCNRQRNNPMTVAKISLTQLNYIATVFGGVRAEELSWKSSAIQSQFLRSEFAESVLDERLYGEEISQSARSSEVWIEGVIWKVKMSSVLWRLWENRIEYWRVRIVIV
jgi:hypothetical protein